MESALVSESGLRNGRAYYPHYTLIDKLIGSGKYPLGKQLRSKVPTIEICSNQCRSICVETKAPILYCHRVFVDPMQQSQRLSLSQQGRPLPMAAAAIHRCLRAFEILAPVPGSSIGFLPWNLPVIPGDASILAVTFAQLSEVSRSRACVHSRLSVSWRQSCTGSIARAHRHLL